MLQSNFKSSDGPNGRDYEGRHPQQSFAAKLFTIAMVCRRAVKTAVFIVLVMIAFYLIFFGAMAWLSPYRLQ